jgi:hypothetical protein
MFGQDTSSANRCIFVHRCVSCFVSPTESVSFCCSSGYAQNDEKRDQEFPARRKRASPEAVGKCNGLSATMPMRLVDVKTPVKPNCEGVRCPSMSWQRGRRSDQYRPNCESRKPGECVICEPRLDLMECAARRSEYEVWLWK